MPTISKKNDTLPNSVFNGQPRWTLRVTYGWCVGGLIFAGVYFFWASGGMVCLPPDSYGHEISDLFHSSIFRGYALVAGSLCTISIPGALAMVQPWGKNLPRWFLLVVAWSTCVVLLLGISTGLIVIDVLRLFSFIPFPVDIPGFILRGLFLAGGILWGVRTLIYQRWSRHACLFCGRATTSSFAGWKKFSKSAGYLSCLPALVYGGLKIYWSIGGSLGYVNREAALAEGHVGQFDFTAVLAALAMVLSLALIQPWGEKVPRWILLFVAFGASSLLILGGLTGLATVLFQVQSSAHLPIALGGLLVPIFIIVYICFLFWGIMLGIAACFYADKTRDWCKHCQRGR
ncbi:hypothetical protein BN2127_JRS1_02756 [Bacillus cereus]|nr:hypothetical protein BN2127_JRS1_02756 [Bacillus cereus]